MGRRNRLFAYLALAVTVFVVSPIDDIILASLSGAALFGFGTSGFYAFLILMTTVSILIWMKGGLKCAIGDFSKKLPQINTETTYKLSARKSK
jgi:hypothetical protein